MGRVFYTYKEKFILGVLETPKKKDKKDCFEEPGTYCTILKCILMKEHGIYVLNLSSFG